MNTVDRSIERINSLLKNLDETANNRVAFVALKASIQREIRELIEDTPHPTLEVMLQDTLRTWMNLEYHESTEAHTEAVTELRSTLKITQRGTETLERINRIGRL